MKTEERPYERVAEGLRRRIAAGEWQPGEMIPARRILAAEYGVAVATLERAAGALIAEGLLSASDRRGTFVAHRRDKSRDFGESKQSLSSTPKTPIHATVGIIAGIVPYDSTEEMKSQWPAQILAALEHGLSTENGLTQRFTNRIHRGANDLTVTQAVEEVVSNGVSAVAVIGDASLEGAVALCDAKGIPLVDRKSVV